VSGDVMLVGARMSNLVRIGRSSIIVPQVIDALHAASTVRTLSSNPMFTHSPVPNVPDDKYFRDPNRKDSDESFMSRHSGKIGMLALASAIGMLYSYFKGNFNERDMEKEVADNQAVEPIEVNEVRFRGQGLTLGLYDALVLKVPRQYPTGLATYSSFVDFALQEAKQKSGFVIISGHILDRIVFKHVAKLGEAEQGGEAFEASVPLPTPFLLTMLNMTVQAAPLQRAQSLFEVARIIDALKDTTNTDVDSLRGQATISVDAATQIIAHLADSCQLPGEKQVMMYQQYPVRQYRKKTAAEIVGLLTYCSCKRPQRN
jgi:hypothetical protein